MKVHRVETAAGVLEKVLFHAEDEDQATFKAAIKTWEGSNGICETWEEFFDYCEIMELGRVVLIVPPA